MAAAHDPAGNGKFSFEYRIKRRDGEVRRIVGRAQTLFIGEGAERHPVRTVGAELDVTDRRLAEAKMRDSEARFRTMADGSPVMIWAMDANGRIEFVNKAVCEFFGATLRSLQSTGWDPLLHPDDVLPYSAAYEAAVAERRQFRAQARVRKANGDWRWIESNATPRLGPSGEFLGYVGVSPDITVLVEAQEALREADQRKDDFLATLAHELRNPLAPIRTAAEMLTRPDLSETQLVWSRQVIHRQVEHMARLLDDLLDVARITRGKVELKIEPRRPRHDRRHRRRGGAAADHGQKTRSDDRLAAGAAHARRGSRSGRASAVEPADQCREVHRPAGPHTADGARRRRRVAHFRQGRRHRASVYGPREDLRDVLARPRLARPRRKRARHRSRARAKV